MIKTLKISIKQDKEKYRVPRKVQDVIPISCIWPDGIFKVGNKFFSDLPLFGHQLSGGVARG